MQFEKEGSAAVAQTYGRSASRITFEIKDPRGFAEFSRQLAEHDAQGSAHMSRGFQGARPSLYDFEADIRKLEMPALIIVGDEDERCIEPGFFLKETLSASGLAILPKTGHAVNLEEPDLFNLAGRSFPRPRGQRQLVTARSAHAWDKAAVASGTSSRVPLILSASETG